MRSREGVRDFLPLLYHSSLHNKIPELSKTRHPELPAGSTGVLDITSPTPFAALTLRSLNNERNDFLMTTFPIADADRTAPSPVVFPQIADGGGFVTGFILLNAGGASKTTLSFFDNEGRQLAVGK